MLGIRWVNKEIMKLILVFSDESFDKYELALCNKHVIRPRFQDKGAMLLKCRSTLVNVRL